MSDFGTPPPPPPFPTFPTEPPPQGPVRNGPAWEASSAPLLQRFIDTTKAVLLDPTNTFATMRREGGLQNPLMYYIVGAVIACVATIFWHTLGLTPGGRGAAGGGIAFLIFMPVIYLLSVFIGSGIYHVLLGLLGGRNYPFETTFRVVAYAAGATFPFAIVPFCGSAIGGLWGMICMIVGLAQAQETSTGKAAAAVLIPVVICCGLVMLFWAAIAALVVGGAAAGAFSH